MRFCCEYSPILSFLLGRIASEKKPDNIDPTTGIILFQPATATLFNAEEPDNRDTFTATSCSRAESEGSESRPLLSREEDKWDLLPAAICLVSRSQLSAPQPRRLSSFTLLASLTGGVFTPQCRGAQTRGRVMLAVLSVVNYNMIRIKIYKASVLGRHLGLVSSNQSIFLFHRVWCS